MAAFTTCIRRRKNNGLYPVYIRVYHKNELHYINTGLLVNEKGLKTVYDKNGNKQFDISDRVVLKKCMDTISTYVEKMNLTDAESMDCKTLIDYLTNKTDDISFTDYAKEYIKTKRKGSAEKTIEMCELSIKKLHEFVGKNNILFKELTSRVIREWIDTMQDSARKKSLYPSNIRAIFNAAILKYNDPELDVIRIRFNPFDRVKIPAEEVPQKRSVEADVVRTVLTSTISYPAGHEDDSRKELGRDVAMMIFCLAGINASDLYDFKIDALRRKDWKLCYNRKKTRGKSKYGAYTEITVPEVIRPLFDKYRGAEGMLLAFSERYVEGKDFVKNVNKGLKAICEELGVEKVTTYTFRHSWATIAQNNCGASTELVAFALNHASVHKITEGYIRKDYSPIDRLNGQVIEFVLQK